MKIHPFLIVGLSSLVLAGCGAPEEKPRKGKYKPEVQLTTLELPGMTPEMRSQAEAQMQAGFAQQVGGETCIGATDKGEWKQASEKISKGLGGQCTTVRDASTDSSVDIEVKCTGTQMGDLTTTVKGSAESESFSTEINLNMEKLPTGESGKLGMKISAKRVGDC